MAQYLKTLLVAAATVFLGVAAVNLVVDPYRLFRVSAWNGINRIKPYASHEERLGKAYLAEWVPAKGLILGNSRAEIGFDPEHPAWLATPVLNLAIAGTALAQSYAYLRHASVFERPEVVVLGVDFMDFRVTGGTPPQAAGAAHEGNTAATATYDLAVFPDGKENVHYGWNKWKNRLSRTVSLDAFWHSLGTIYLQNDPYSQDLTGHGFNPLRDYQKIVRNEGYHATFKQRDRENSTRYGRGPKEVFLNSRHGSPVFDTFRDIVRFCDDRGIRLIVVIYPYHAHLLEIFRAAGLWAQFEDWKRELVSIVETAPGRTTTLWDFSGYTGFSTENVPTAREKTREVQWYWEAGHFKKELGDMIQTRIFDSVSAPNSSASEFGVRLSPGNIDGHLAYIRMQQGRYQSAYPNDVADLNSLVESNSPKISAKP